MFNLQEVLLKLQFGKQSADMMSIDYDDLIFGSCSFSLTYEEGLELAKYVLNVGETKSWKGNLVLHTGIKHSLTRESFAISTALGRFISAASRNELMLSNSDKIGLAKFFLNINEEKIVDSKIVLRTYFTRGEDGGVNLHGG